MPIHARIGAQTFSRAHDSLMGSKPSLASGWASQSAQLAAGTLPASPARQSQASKTIRRPNGQIGGTKGRDERCPGKPNSFPIRTACADQQAATEQPLQSAHARQPAADSEQRLLVPFPSCAPLFPCSRRTPASAGSLLPRARGPWPAVAVRGRLRRQKPWQPPPSVLSCLFSAPSASTGERTSHGGRSDPTTVATEEDVRCRGFSHRRARLLMAERAAVEETLDGSVPTPVKQLR